MFNIQYSIKVQCSMSKKLKAELIKLKSGVWDLSGCWSLGVEHFRNVSHTREIPRLMECLTNF